MVGVWTAGSSVVGGSRKQCQSRGTGFGTWRGWSMCDSQGKIEGLVDKDERAGGLCRDSELLCCLREVRGSSMENEDVGNIGG